MASRIEDGEDYRRLFNAVFTQVVELNAGPGAQSGPVSPDLVRHVLTDVMAAVDFNCGLGDRRKKHAQAIAGRYTIMVRGMMQNPAMDIWPQAARLDN